MSGARAAPGSIRGDALLQLERAVLLGGLAAVTALCWRQLLRSASATPSAAPAPHELAVALSTWAIMMTAMMLPAATPMILTYAAASRRTLRNHRSCTLLFVLAYVGILVLVSTIGAATQTSLRATGLISHRGASTNPLLSGVLLLLAGAYQVSPFKQACLRRCRTPLGFLMTEWRPGSVGAMRMGVRHGADCIRCCWALMALTFVLGTMSLPWMVLLTLLVVAEKALPGGQRIGTAAGVILVAWGVRVLVGMA